MMLVGFCIILYHLLRDDMPNGNAWKQGDWLINSMLEEVRRGVLGRMILHLSDLTGSNPVHVVFAIQITLLALCYLTLYWLYRVSDAPLLFLLLIASPAMLVIFWPADPQGTLRKEMFAVLALTLAAIGTIEHRRPLWVLAAVLLCIGFWGHEVNVLFIPLFLAISVLGVRERTDRMVFAGLCLITCLMGALAMQYVFAHTRPSDVTNICGPLLSRGLDETICNGAIKWLQFDSVYATARIHEHILDKGLHREFLLSYALALAPWVYILALSTRRALIVVFAFLLWLPFAPLYLVSLDWGRWMSLHVFSLTLLYLTALRVGVISLRANPKAPVVFGFLGVGLLLSSNHMAGLYMGGVLRVLARDIYHFLT